MHEQYLAMCVKLGHVELQPSSARETFSNIELNKEEGKKFNGKLAIFQKRCDIGPMLLLITNRKWRTHFQIK